MQFCGSLGLQSTNRIWGQTNRKSGALVNIQRDNISRNKIVLKRVVWGPLHFIMEFSTLVRKHFYTWQSWLNKVQCNIDGLVQEGHNSIASALELWLPCTNPLKWYCTQQTIKLWGYFPGIFAKCPHVLISVPFMVAPFPYLTMGWIKSLHWLPAFPNFSPQHFTGVAYIPLVGFSVKMFS